jgi:hypothetical protein
MDYFSRLYLMLGIKMTATSRDHFVTGEEARCNDKEYKKNLEVTKKRAIKTQRQVKVNTTMHYEKNLPSCITNLVLL